MHTCVSAHRRHCWACWCSPRWDVGERCMRLPKYTTQLTTHVDHWLIIAIILHVLGHLAGNLACLQASEHDPYLRASGTVPQLLISACELCLWGGVHAGLAPIAGPSRV
eukprot:1144956-Pelagomonas_calceolata.AAC.4